MVLVKFRLVTGEGEPEQVDGAFVSANLFPTLGVNPELGRGFTTEEQREGADHVVIISHGLWQRRFGGDGKVIGKTIRVSDAPHEIVGVMPAGFQFPDQTSWLPGSGAMGLWVPLALDGNLEPQVASSEVHRPAEARRNPRRGAVRAGFARAADQ